MHKNQNNMFNTYYNTLGKINFPTWAQKQRKILPNNVTFTYRTDTYRYRNFDN